MVPQVFLYLEKLKSNLPSGKSSYQQTNKKDKIKHGRGIRSVRKVAEKYGGELLDVYKRQGYELYSKRWLQYAKNGWKKENDLVLKIGFDSSGSVSYTHLFKTEQLHRFFPVSYTTEQMRREILEMLKLKIGRAHV